jgi:hypothetical protein
MKISNAFAEEKACAPAVNEPDRSTINGMFLKLPQKKTHSHHSIYRRIQFNAEKPHPM